VLRMKEEGVLGRCCNYMPSRDYSRDLDFGIQCRNHVPERPPTITAAVPHSELSGQKISWPLLLVLPVLKFAVLIMLERRGQGGQILFLLRLLLSLRE